MNERTRTNGWMNELKSERESQKKNERVQEGNQKQ